MAALRPAAAGGRANAPGAQIFQLLAGEDVNGRQVDLGVAVLA